MCLLGQLSIYINAKLNIIVVTVPNWCYHGCISHLVLSIALNQDQDCFPPGMFYDHLLHGTVIGNIQKPCLFH